MRYYDGTKLLNYKDLQGGTPEIYICCGNRSAGKTTFFNKLLVDGFKERHEKFMLLYRYKVDLQDVSDKFFKDVNNLFYSGSNMVDKPLGDGSFRELFLDGESCGYAVSLNSAVRVKQFSHYFSDVKRMLMDEFQSEDNKYLTNEVNKLQSIHTSVARGNGMPVRYVPVYMVSNTVSILNPYFIALGISSRLTSETKYLRGDGWVLEKTKNKDVAKLQKDSAFNRAFSADSDYNTYLTDNSFLNDSDTFISTPNGKNRYLCTLKYLGKNYGVKEYENGVVFCDTSFDASFPVRLSLGVDDHDINYVLYSQNPFLIAKLRYYFNHGAFRFKNQQSKDCILHLLSY